MLLLLLYQPLEQKAIVIFKNPKYSSEIVI